MTSPKKKKVRPNSDAYDCCGGSMTCVLNQESMWCDKILRMKNKRHAKEFLMGRLLDMGETLEIKNLTIEQLKEKVTK